MAGLPRTLKRVIERLARRRALLGFDFDGTLAPIVADRTAGRMRATTRALLARVCSLYRCTIISGRSVSDLRGRLAGVKPRYLVGNHGIDPSPRKERFRPTIAAARAHLVKALQSWPDIDIEDKTYSLSLHYRDSRRPASARRAIARAIAAFRMPLRIVAGKQVINAVPVGAPHKGDVMVALCWRERAEAALYVGDDVTDEDVFAIDLEDLATVRVGRSRRSRAQAFLRDQASVDSLLALLAELRAGDVRRGITPA
jgi:trehalose 6-phosphate phosphatase